MHYEFFPEVRIALMREIAANHPALTAILQEDPSESFEDKLVKVATYCNIAVDGDYTQEDLNRVCEACFTRLKERSTSLILPYNI